MWQTYLQPHAHMLFANSELRVVRACCHTLLLLLRDIQLIICFTFELKRCVNRKSQMFGILLVNKIYSYSTTQISVGLCAHLLVFLLFTIAY